MEESIQHPPLVLSIALPEEDLRKIEALFREVVRLREENAVLRLKPNIVVDADGGVRWWRTSEGPSLAQVDAAKRPLTTRQSYEE